MQAEGFDDLVGRAQAGDRQAVEQLLAAIRPWLEQRARRYADPERPDASTSDLAQEAWLRAWRKLDQFQAAGDDELTLARFRAWLGRIVHRLGLNVVRDQQAQHRRPPGKLVRLDAPVPGESTGPGAGLSPATGEPTPSAAAEADERSRRIRQALEKIPDETDREIVRLRFFESLSLRQIAERLRLNHEKVRQRYHAVLRHLEHDLKGLQ